jgi:geranyl-CoA carboxylase alpha subunit
VLRHPAFLGDAVSTALIDEHFGDAAARADAPGDVFWALAAFISTRVEPPARVWPPEWRGWSSTGTQRSPFRLVTGRAELRGYVEGAGVLAATVHGARAVPVEARRPLEPGAWNTVAVDGRQVAFFFARADERLWLQVDGVEAEFEDVRLRAAARTQLGASAGAITAAMHGRVVEVAVEPGQRVARGAPLATLEAMKMEHALAAPAPGRVRAVHVRAGDQVAAGRVVIELELDAIEAVQ